MQPLQTNKIIRGGLIATTVMTIVMLMAPLMGMPKMLIGNMLAHFMHIPIIYGWVAHFMIGTFIAGGYLTYFAPRLRLNRVLKGTLYSLIPFIIAQTVVMPMMGAGFFSANTGAPALMVMGSLIGHLVYGAVLGLTVDAQPVKNAVLA